MFPLPTDAARYAFAGCTLAFLSGLLADASVVVLLGAGGLVGVALCLALTVATAARLRRQMLSFSWRAPAGAASKRSIAGRVGSPIVVRCRMRNPGDQPVFLARLLPSSGSGLSLARRPSDLVVAGRSGVEFTLQLMPHGAGRQVLHGLSVLVPGPLGLFAAPLYFPTPLSLRVLPRQPRPPEKPTSPLAGLAAPHLDTLRRPRKGDGNDIRELRELQPGDPYRAIAWKASARRGRFLVREMEQDSHLMRDIVIDVSFAMRSGDIGQRPLDRALDIAAVLAHAAISDGDRVSLCTVDGRELTRAAEGAGLSHLRLIYDALIDCVHVTDADLSEADADAVRDAVVHYMRRQEGEASGPAPDEERAVLARRARQALGADTDLARAPLGSDADDVTLRAFCLSRGIPLPYREFTRNFAKGLGMSQALKRSAGHARVPRQMVLLCDLAGITDLSPLSCTLGMLRARGHDVVVAVPAGYRPLTTGTLEEAPAQALDWEAKRLFARHRVSVVPFNADEAAGKGAHRILSAWAFASTRLRSA